jgi:release factor glutamine methyltransferase
VRRVAITLGSILAEATAALSRAGYDEPRRRARQLLTAALGLTTSASLLMAEHELAKSEADELYGLVERLAKGEPLGRVLGRREFWGLEFELSSATLDPRPESETVVESVLAQVDRRAPLGILDLGTGSGCLLLALLSELPAASGIGVDILQEAVTTAGRNARLLGLADRARFFVGDWGTAIGQRFDVVVANPPYVATSMLPELPREVREYDPQPALDGGEDGLAAYRRISLQLRALLGSSGLFVAEIGMGQAAKVTTILGDQGLRVAAVARDLAGIERCVVARASRGQHFEPTILGQKSLGMCPHRV